MAGWSVVGRLDQYYGKVTGFGPTSGWEYPSIKWAKNQALSAEPLASAVVKLNAHDTVTRHSDYRFNFYRSARIIQSESSDTPAGPCAEHLSLFSFTQLIQLRYYVFSQLGSSRKHSRTELSLVRTQLRACKQCGICISGNSAVRKLEAHSSLYIENLDRTWTPKI